MQQLPRGIRTDFPRPAVRRSQLWEKNSTHSWNTGVKRANGCCHTQCPRIGLQIGKALTKFSPHYNLRYRCNEIIFNKLKSLHAQISFIRIFWTEKKNSHFRHKPFLGEQKQKVLQSFWKGWLHMENHYPQCD